MGPRARGVAEYFDAVITARRLVLNFFNTFLGFHHLFTRKVAHLYISMLAALNLFPLFII